jgi:hypothetical protein
MMPWSSKAAHATGRRRAIYLVCSLGMGLMAGGAHSGNLDAPAVPDDAISAMYTLADLYQRLVDGSAGTKRDVGFAEPGSGPSAGTMHTLNDIMDKMPVMDDGDGAATANVLEGKTFWGLLTAGWGSQTGTMANIGKQDITPGTSAQTINQGYHNGTGTVAGDTDLVADNIRSGVTLFGVAGNPNVVNTSSGDAAATDLLAGKKAWVDGAEVTGTYEGTETPPCNCDCATCFIWNEDGGGTRWCDNGNGTVTDLFGADVDGNGKIKGRCLVWLKDAGWGGPKPWRALETATDENDDAHSRAGILANGQADLNDGSDVGDWRLPTRNEIRALTTDPQGVLSLWWNSIGSPFLNVEHFFGYWSSTTKATDNRLAWFMSLNSESGQQDYTAKWNTDFYVWPVRGGQ